MFVNMALNSQNVLLPFTTYNSLLIASDPLECGTLSLLNSLYLLVAALHDNILVPPRIPSPIFRFPKAVNPFS